MRGGSKDTKRQSLLASTGCSVTFVLPPAPRETCAVAFSTTRALQWLKHPAGIVREKGIRSRYLYERSASSAVCQVRTQQPNWNHSLPRVRKRNLVRSGCHDNWNQPNTKLLPPCFRAVTSITGFIRPGYPRRRALRDPRDSRRGRDGYGLQGARH